MLERPRWHMVSPELIERLLSARTEAEAQAMLEQAEAAATADLEGLFAPGLQHLVERIKCGPEH